MQKELCALFSQGWDKDNGVPIVSKEVIETYFKANPNTVKFCYTPPAFLNLLQELFNGFLTIRSNARLINKVIESYIDPKILIATALQATDLVSKEDKEEGKEEDNKDFKLESARGSLKHSQLSLPSINCSGTSSTPKSSLIPS